MKGNEFMSPLPLEEEGQKMSTGLLDAALEIATERRATLAQMRKALERGDDAEALRHARTLCGLADEPSPSKKDSAT